jgi:predicted outer membrane protein
MSRQFWAKGIWGVAIVVGCSALAIAAVPQQGQFRGQSQPQTQQLQAPQQIGEPGAHRGPMAGQEGLDHYFVKVLVNANKDEIEMGKLAQQHSRNADVKKVASQMVQDHTNFLNKLESFKRAEHQGSDVHSQQPIQGRAAFRGTPDGTNQQQDQAEPQNAQRPGIQGLQLPQSGQPGNQNTQRFRGMRRGPMAGAAEHGTAAHFAKIMEEVDRNVQQSMMRDLAAKEGTQFDRCYLASQLFGHMWVVEALQSFERDASPQLKPILQEGLQVSQQHLNHVKNLLARLDNQPGSNQGIQQPGANQNNQPRGRLR